MWIAFLEVAIAAAFFTNGVSLLAGKPSMFLDARYLEQVSDRRAFSRALGCSLIGLGVFWTAVCLIAVHGKIAEGAVYNVIYALLLGAQVLNLVRIFRKYQKKP